MFEFEVQTPTHIRVRIGRWHFRTWRSRFMLLPKGYRSPELVYSVEQDDDRDDSVIQYAAFFDERQARACLDRLTAEGRSGLLLNITAVHERLDDWEFDR